jgi:hypothetical protein
LHHSARQFPGWFSNKGALRAIVTRILVLSSESV